MTDDYTPSLDHGRNVYGRVHDIDGIPQQSAERRAEFDRMIEAVRAEEREKAAQIADWSGGTESVYIAARIREQE